MFASPAAPWGPWWGCWEPQPERLNDTWWPATQFTPPEQAPSLSDLLPEMGEHLDWTFYKILKYTPPTLNFEQMMESYAVCCYRKTHPGQKHNFIQNNFSWFVPQSVSILKITCAVAGLLNKVTSLPHHPPAGQRPHQSTAIWGRRGGMSSSVSAEDVKQ